MVIKGPPPRQGSYACISIRFAGLIYPCPTFSPIFTITIPYVKHMNCTHGGLSGTYTLPYPTHVPPSLPYLPHTRRNGWHPWYLPTHLYYFLCIFMSKNTWLKALLAWLKSADATHTAIGTGWSYFNLSQYQEKQCSNPIQFHSVVPAGISGGGVSPNLYCSEGR